MQITVAGKQVDLSDALRTRVTEHLDTIARKYFDHALEAQVTFSRARSFFTCDINLHAGHGLLLRGEGEAADAHAAFDDAAEHIAKRLRRYRRRVNEHARDTANRDRPQAARQYILQQEDTAEGEPGDGGRIAYATVIAEARADIATLSVSEAVMRMDLADQQVMMFRNSASGELNVVYRRSDGHIGWIDPSTTKDKS
ncbi:MAG TPA: ribosome-associated translation inhibitor RaiA [Acidisphaera sp.]|nr:ribosome-associated translation inhibitor RaiA [Acidisphaera sp.]